MLGVDFGTSYTSAGAFVGGLPHVLEILRTVYDIVMERLAAYDDERRRLFACACAARALVVVERILPGLWTDACRDALAQASGGMLARDVAERVAARLETLPETDLDDSHDPRYYGMLALSIVVDAVRAAGGDARAAASASDGALNLASALSYGAPGDPLLRAEEDAQRRWLTALEAHDGRPGVGTSFDADAAVQYDAMARRLLSMAPGAVTRR